MINFSEVYIYSDQPTICPQCSSRADILMDFSHTLEKTEVHQCLDNNCKYEFVIKYDKEFEDYDTKVNESDGNTEIEVFT
jgi:hypothetical protein